MSFKKYNLLAMMTLNMLTACDRHAARLDPASQKLSSSQQRKLPVFLDNDFLTLQPGVELRSVKGVGRDGVTLVYHDARNHSTLTVTARDQSRCGVVYPENITRYAASRQDDVQKQIEHLDYQKRLYTYYIMSADPNCYAPNVYSVQIGDLDRHRAVLRQFCTNIGTERLGPARKTIETWQPVPSLGTFSR